ncbi:hypothetical protein, partial [Treponema sp. R6D11]
LYDDEILSIFPILQIEIMRHIAKTAGADIGELEKAKYMRILFLNIKKVPNLNIKNIFNATSKIHQILLQDPLDIYAIQDETSQNSYRVEIKKQADYDVFSYAEKLLKQAKEENLHIGEVIFRNKNNHKTAYIISYIALACAFFGILLHYNNYLAVLSLPLVLLLTEKIIVKIFSKLIPPRILPRIRYHDEDIPKTLVAVSCLAISP